MTETADTPSAETKPSKTASVLELLASRICHDLVSPVGAINNGVRFMEEMGEDPAQRAEALNLISHSATQASAKLMAFRIAYGAGGRDPNIKPEDVQKAFSQLISGDGKITQAWDPHGNLGPKTPALRLLQNADGRPDARHGNAGQGRLRHGASR